MFLLGWICQGARWWRMGGKTLMMGSGSRGVCAWCLYSVFVCFLMLHQLIGFKLLQYGRKKVGKSVPWFWWVLWSKFRQGHTWFPSRWYHILVINPPPPQIWDWHNLWVAPNRHNLNFIKELEIMIFCFQFYPELKIAWKSCSFMFWDLITKC